MENAEWNCKEQQQQLHQQNIVSVCINTKICCAPHTLYSVFYIVYTKPITMILQETNKINCHHHRLLWQTIKLSFGIISLLEHIYFYIICDLWLPIDFHNRNEWVHEVKENKLKCKKHNVKIVKMLKK